jgi:DNA-binding MarR family transcriptional regulator
MAAISVAVDDERDPVEERLLIHAVERLMSAGVGVTVRAIGESGDASSLTLAQWRVLVVACRSEGLRVGELAALLGISVPSASRLIRRVEARLLVNAVRAHDDRRATVIRPTEAGRRLVQDVTRRRRDLIGGALTDTPSGPDADASALIDAIAAQLGELG